MRRVGVSRRLAALGGLLVLLALLSFTPGGGPLAQDSQGADAAAQEGGSDSDGSPQTPASVETADLERLLATLEDPERRQQLVKDLRALLALQRGEGTSTPPIDTIGTGEEGKPETAAGEAAGQLVGEMEEHADKVTSVLGRVLDAVAQVERLPAWFEEQVDKPERREFWIEIATVGLGLPLLVAILARWLVALALRGVVRRLQASDPRSVQARVFTALARSVLEAFQVAAVLAAGYAVLWFVDRSFQAARIAELVIWGFALQTGIGVFARLLLAPYSIRLRPLPIGDEGAAYTYLWVMRLSLVAVVGFVLSRISLPLGASWSGMRAIEIGAASVLAGMFLVLIIQSRRQVANFIKGRGTGEKGPGQVRRRLADIWHVLAIIYVLVVFGIFVSGARDGFSFISEATGVTFAAIIAVSILVEAMARLLRMLFRVDDDLDRRFPGLRERSNLYRPMLSRALGLILWLIALVVILEAWDIDVYTALEAETRAGILHSAAIVLVVVVISLLVWEYSARSIAKALSGTNPDGSPREASGRAKTLLPLLKRTILIVLGAFAVMVILSQIGVDIGPLLAGAGVLGLAIGFGSQALVRDLITGLFILIEDTVAVGDVVTAGGHTGVVEELSLRTIRLRDLSGSVHVVPFGDVTSVINMTRDFAYALMDVGVAYREDTDYVSAVLTEIAADLQADLKWSAEIMAPMEVLGVQELADSAVVIRCRIMTRPMMQWAVKREFYRRMKKRFDEEGIEIPFPHTTLYFGVDKEGEAPPGRILFEADRAAKTLEEKGIERSKPTSRTEGASGEQQHEE